MALQTVSARDRLRVVGQGNLGAWIEAARGKQLWTIQHQIATALSEPRARVAVPSCNASGKTFLAANLALAFYDAFTPGTPCTACDPTGEAGGCRGCKVITTSSKEIHLKDNLWGEIRMAIAELANQGIAIPGDLPPAETFLMDSPGNHFLRGQVATKEESFQGYHAAHKLIIGDEATSVSEDVARGITSLLATADTRLLLIFNPTTPETYAAQATRNERFETIKITAFDTPHFTGEEVPEGSNLVTPGFLQDLEMGGMGPGSYEWTTRVLAEFWDLGDDVLIPQPWVAAARIRPITDFPKISALGIDLAPFGNAENVVGHRTGDCFDDILASPAGRVDHYINGDPDHPEVLSPVQRMVEKWGPNVITFDSDGVGAGAVGEFQRLKDWGVRKGYMQSDAKVIGFRGGVKIMDAYLNARSAWWWALRKRFERGSIQVTVADQKLEAQLSQMTYSINTAGAIRVETKSEMRKRGLDSPDRADVVMYCFAFSEELPDPNAADARGFAEAMGYVDMSDNAIRDRLFAKIDRKKKRPPMNPVTGIPDDGLD